MNELVKQYLFFFSCKNAATTANRVGYQLRAFVRYFEARNLHGFYQLEANHLLKWNSYLKSKYHKRTVASKHSAVKGLLTWLTNENYFLVNPWPEYLQIKQGDALPRAYPSKKSAVQFLNHIHETTLFSDRNRAILELCYSSGLRRGELYQLNARDIKGDWLKVTGKGNRERLVPLGSKAKSWLSLYLKGERMGLLKRYNCQEEALFLNLYGSRLGLQSFSHIVRNSRPQNSKWTLHSFRHACATHMLENGAGIRVLQKLLGHKKLSSTQVYTRVEMSSLKKVLEMYHPRG